ncbi:suppressor of cytokine signaling 7 isoform X2 [Eucyclogobius newberryi]|uniref:suppressor of cytokine signaling 7 isoform X2 n=1 Tax=Eucyclogobius newberryi TaxID=166745 RepID=UPI003B58D124
MNDAQEMSPDFVLMRLVSAAEERLDAENGNVSAVNGVALGHSGGKAALELSREQGLDNKAESEPQRREAPGFEFSTSPGLRPQLLVFPELDLDRGPTVNNNNNGLSAQDAERPEDEPPGADRATRGAVFELARRFGELPRCSCQAPHAPGATGPEVDDPTETSDALLVLEGLGGALDEPQSDADDAARQDFLLHRKRDIVQKMSVSISSLQAELTRQVQAHVQGADGGVSTDVTQVTAKTPVSPGPHWARSPSPVLTCMPSLTCTPRRRPERCSSAPRTPCTGRATAAAGEKTLKGKSKKGLKVRLSKLFRTKSCSGSSHLLDKRPSMTSVSSSNSLLDVGAEQDTAHSQPRLTRAHSAFSPAALSASLSAFAGETVSLVDVDISRRGTHTPHPPTPPPPPRRSLSLLDAFLRALPLSTPSAAEAPPPRQAPPSVLCALRRSEASNFAASLRELEKCGWYWGPMNWGDAEMKLKGKPDGSFLVRDSSDPRYILSLSFRSQGVTHHTRMEHYRGTFSLWCHPKFEDRCHSVVEFIERAIMHSKNGKFLYFLRSRVPGLPPTPVQLLYPVSRFSNVKSLQHLCRFCIRQIVRIDHIQELPLPRPLISYLSKFYYYDPEEEMYMSVKSVRSTKEAEPETQT